MKFSKSVFNVPSLTLVALTYHLVSEEREAQQVSVQRAQFDTGRTDLSLG